MAQHISLRQLRPPTTARILLFNPADAVLLTSTETIVQLTIATGGSVIISNAQAMTLGSNILVNGNLSVNGTLVCSANTITGTGTFSLSTGATLNIGSTTGITASGSTGNVQTAIRTFSAAANYVYTSTSAQVTGNGLPAVVTGSITDNNTNVTSGLTLTQSIAVNSPGSFGVPVSGVLTCGAATNITGTGSFALSSGGKLFIGSTGGISATAGTGNVQLTGTRTFSASANYVYNGSVVQNMGNALPSPLTGTLNVANTNPSGCSLNNNLVVNAPGTVTFSSALTCPATFIISGTGTFNLISGGTLLTANTASISATGISGSIQTSALNFATDAYYIYYSSLSQVTGSGLPAMAGGLYINSSAPNVSLTNNVTVNGNLTLNAGTLCLNGNTLTMASGRTIIRQSGILSLCGGGLTYAGTINLNYTSASNITPGVEMPSSTTALNNLTLALATGRILTLNSNITVNGSVTMTSGALALGSNTLTYAAGTSLIYNGTAAQTVSEEWPNTAFSTNITVKNTFATSGVALDANKTIYRGTLTVNNAGYFNSNGFTLTASGNIAVNAGGTFITSHALGISPSGAVQLTGTRNFATGSGYTFNGASAQVTGIEMPASVSNITISNTAPSLSVTLSNTGSGTQTVPGTLALTSGAFDISANNMSLVFLTGNTPISQSAGSLTTATNTSLQFGATGNTGGAAFTLPNNTFTAAPVLTNLTVNRTNSLTLGNQNITLTGALNLTNGQLNIGSSTLGFKRYHQCRQRHS